MGEDLSLLTRYFVVNCRSNPVSTAMRSREKAEFKAWRMNHTSTDNVRGIPEGRPYRVVTLAPAADTEDKG